MRAKPLLLIVDDEANLLEIFSTALGAAGFDIATASNGKDAVAAAGKIKPDLILMDIHMPGESGTDAALEIKQNPETKDLRIAFLSNLKEPWPAVPADRAEVSKEIGMEDFIEKTADLNTITAKVREILARK